MYKANSEKASEMSKAEFIDMAEFFSYQAYLQFIEDSSNSIIDGASSY